MPRRKVILVIVEGISEETALGTLLTKIFPSNLVFVDVICGDITTREGVSGAKIVAAVRDEIKRYAERNKLKQKDFQEVIHLIDTDGVYIENSNVIEDSDALSPIYLQTGIRTCRKTGIEGRNSQKRENLNRLWPKGTIWNVPYRVYYMSCNLDHVLYDKPNSSDCEKEENAIKFAEKYEFDVPGFKQFMTLSAFSVMSGYKESWEFISKGLNSLKRYTNMGLCLPEENAIKL